MHSERAYMSHTEITFITYHHTIPRIISLALLVISCAQIFLGSRENE